MNYKLADGNTVANFSSESSLHNTTENLQKAGNLVAENTELIIEIGPRYGIGVIGNTELNGRMAAEFSSKSGFTGVGFTGQVRASGTNVAYLKGTLSPGSNGNLLNGRLKGGIGKYALGTAATSGDIGIRFNPGVGVDLSINQQNKYATAKVTPLPFVTLGIRFYGPRQ